MRKIYEDTVDKGKEPFVPKAKNLTPALTQIQLLTTAIAKTVRRHLELFDSWVEKSDIPKTAFRTRAITKGNLTPALTQIQLLTTAIAHPFKRGYAPGFN